MDNQHELFPAVDEEGQVKGCITRASAHDGTKVLHPVVHLHVFNGEGMMFLQKRPDWKDIQPGRWDTAVGGHVEYGETIDQALIREAREELGIQGFMPRFIGKYVFEGAIERELVYAYATVYDGEVTPNSEELSEGRFFTAQEINHLIGKDFFTPNFESEYNRFFTEK